MAEERTGPVNCLMCQQYHLQLPTGAWSSQTPGMSLDMWCKLRVWEWDEDEHGEEDFRAFMRTAATCEHFAMIKPEEKKDAE